MESCRLPGGIFTLIITQMMYSAASEHCLFCQAAPKARHNVIVSFARWYSQVDKPPAGLQHHREAPRCLPCHFDNSAETMQVFTGGWAVQQCSLVCQFQNGLRLDEVLIEIIFLRHLIYVKCITHPTFP
jgi:hypothetical protein